MIADEIREHQRATPFEPYTIHTSDGKALYVKHPDYYFITPGGDTVYVFSTETAREIVATINITRDVNGRDNFPCRFRGKNVNRVAAGRDEIIVRMFDVKRFSIRSMDRVRLERSRSLMLPDFVGNHCLSK